MRVVHSVPETWYFHPRISKRENYTTFMLRLGTSEVQKSFGSCSLELRYFLSK